MSLKYKLFGKIIDYKDLIDYSIKNDEPIVLNFEWWYSARCIPMPIKDSQTSVITDNIFFVYNVGGRTVDIWSNGQYDTPDLDNRNFDPFRAKRDELVTFLEEKGVRVIDATHLGEVVEARQDAA
jgi:hypothetical protein